MPVGEGMGGGSIRPIHWPAENLAGPEREAPEAVGSGEMDDADNSRLIRRAYDALTWGFISQPYPIF